MRFYVMINTVFLFFFSYSMAFSQPAHATISANDPEGLGRIGYYIGEGTDTAWLGTQAPSSSTGGLVAYCVQSGLSAPVSGDQVISVATLDTAIPRVSGLELTTPQMAYLLDRYKGSTDPAVQSAISLLVHANFEEDSVGSKLYSDSSAQNVVNDIMSTVRKYAPHIESTAQGLASEAKNSAAVGYQPGGVSGEQLRKGNIHSIGVTNQTGAYIEGIPMTVMLSGPAVFDTTGTQIWTGTSQSTPMTLSWKSTGNGKVETSIKFKASRKTLTKLINDQSQNTVTYGNSIIYDPEEILISGPRWDVTYDFQPMGTSQVVKISDDGVFIDTFNALSDPSYGNGKWLNFDDTTTPVPVTFTATAYFMGENPPKKIDVVPSRAVAIESVSVVAKGPGSVKASFKSNKPGFATVVWSVEKSKQPNEVQNYIHSDWADGYGIPNETTSYRTTAEIDSTMSIRETKSGSYLVDDLFVKGFPVNHGDFLGDEYFGSDQKSMTQTLLFFPKGTEVTDENRGAAEEIAKVNVSAQNGYYPNIGATEFKVKRDEHGDIPGTYVFETSFVGDDRVKPFRSSLEDSKEQYVVERKMPALFTSASNTHNGSKEVIAKPEQSITDKVCDLQQSLIPGTIYQVTGSLHYRDGSPVLDSEGKAVSSQIDFLPKDPSECAFVTMNFDASKLNAESVVVFEDIQLAGKTIAVHHDVNEQLQTIKVNKELVAALAVTGANYYVWESAALFLLLGGAGAWMKSQKGQRTSEKL
ncbi:VaFE repeat-containing surface-anchored protein [Arcanobacterium ihumii]|uniref:VaFE repeat-containing surface-anchored protein n=1 Tax=Arcanobacterium ihumii TaxID=2138162 RepID=UPI000F535D77|nr:VaFE repeat-containing surface-anchored protein [Arcanobacterium ihumii]